MIVGRTLRSQTSKHIGLILRNIHCLSLRRWTRLRYCLLPIALNAEYVYGDMSAFSALHILIRHVICRHLLWIKRATDEYVYGMSMVKGQRSVVSGHHKSDGRPFSRYTLYLLPLFFGDLIQKDISIVLLLNEYLIIVLNILGYTTGHNLYVRYILLSKVH